MRILGISCDYHDAAAALIDGGTIVAAAEEERFSRRKHDSALPERAIVSCLAVGGIEAGQVDVVVVHEKPILVAGRVLAARQRRGPAAVGAFARDFPPLLGRNLMIGHRIEQLFRGLGVRRPPPIAYGEHHLSHAAAAFLPSPFESAAILTVDGIGEWATATIGHGVRQRIDLLWEQRYPHSLGLVYSLMTAFCGFAPNDGEYKLMGLAPYGEPRYVDELAQLVDVHDDGSIRVDERRVRWWGTPVERLSGVSTLLGLDPRGADEPLDQRHADLARSVQSLTETAVVRMAAHARSITDEPHLCLAGGVALNCSANSELLRSGTFDDVWVQPAAGDAGSAIGAALWYWHDERGHPRDVAGRSGPLGDRDAMSGAALGPAFGTAEVAAWLDDLGVAALRLPDIADRAEHVARRLADGAVVGWFEGRMEFGPRALGHRSILADPRPATMAADLNIRVKGRESFRPFAPAVMWEFATEWFTMDRPSPYMLFTHQVAPAHRLDTGDEPAGLEDRARIARSDIPACTHVDGSARVQTVHPETSPVFHELLSAFHRLTGCPVLLNTSFNRAGEPIVCTPEDALDTARSAGLDLLVLDELVIEFIAC